MRFGAPVAADDLLGSFDPGRKGLGALLGALGPPGRIGAVPRDDESPPADFGIALLGTLLPLDATTPP
jgi:hypothetical protein